jgi:hypothetical protein
MAERSWIPLESDGKWAGGFCHLLRECLESTGVEATRMDRERLAETFELPPTLLPHSYTR